MSGDMKVVKFQQDPLHLHIISHVGSIPNFFISELRCQHLILKTNDICLVDSANTNRGDALLI